VELLDIETLPIDAELLTRGTTTPEPATSLAAAAAALSFVSLRRRRD
jgi:hypothetical protein